MCVGSQMEKSHHTMGYKICVPKDFIKCLLITIRNLYLLFEVVPYIHRPEISRGSRTNQSANIKKFISKYPRRGPNSLRSATSLYSQALLLSLSLSLYEHVLNSGKKLKEKRKLKTIYLLLTHIDAYGILGGTYI